MINLTIFTKSTFHALRAISLAVFPPAFIMLLIQGIISGDVNPAIGILPLFFSSAYSALLLINEKRCGCQGSGLMGTPVHLVCDLSLAVALFVCLILDWIFITDAWNRGMVMLGTYGTNFLICNFLIHLYFVAKTLSDHMSPGSSYVSSCPQCKNETFSLMKMKDVLRVRQEYMPLLNEEEEEAPRNESAGEV